MAKLQIPIDDELMKKAKLFALENGTTLKDLVISAITNTISNTATTTNTTSTNTIDVEDEDIRDMLRMASDALHDSDTQKVIIYNNPLNIEIDSAPPIQNVFSNDYIIRPEETRDETLTRLDVDPLERMPDEVWQKLLEELKRERGQV